MCIPYIVRALGYKSFRASLALNVNVDRRTCHGGQIRCSCLLARAHDIVSFIPTSAKFYRRVEHGQGGADMFFTVGAELHTVNASTPSAVTKAFGGADVVVNVLSSAPVEYKNALVEAAKAWCPTTNESSSYNNPEWSGERAHIRYARKRSRSSHSTPAPFSKAPPG
ncbi:hypothetical protein AcV5_000036 [Taiwanofungus camphoratus]|nr:hypothetical protein AcV5_000036 [Antrodia cinnamomea]